MAQETANVSFTVETQLGLDVMPAHSDNQHDSPCALMRSISCPTFGDTLVEMES